MEAANKIDIAASYFLIFYHKRGWFRNFLFPVMVFVSSFLESQFLSALWGVEHPFIS